METNTTEAPKKSLNFIEAMVEQDLREGRNDGRIQTRFPPEPNGYLHIGHAKAICLDFGIAEKYNGICNLRFDDTNPVKEDVEYVDSIMEDIQWLGYQWENVYYASDYFQQLWNLAEKLILQGKAYVDEQSAETIAKQKGTPTQAGTESPFRNRPAERIQPHFDGRGDQHALSPAPAQQSGHGHFLGIRRRDVPSPQGGEETRFLHPCILP